MKRPTQEPPRSPIRRLARRLLAVVVGFVFALLLGEVVLAVVWTRPVLAVGTELVDTGLFVPDPECGWSMPPSKRVRHELPWGGQVSIETNSDGFRDVHHASDDARPRVIVLGDSFTFGFGVEGEQAFPRKLAALLPDVAVHNFGQTGFNTAQEHALLRTRGMALEPRVVVLAFCMNDVELQTVPDRRQRRTPAPPANGLKGFLSRHSSVYEVARTFIAGNKRCSRLLVELNMKERLPGYEALDSNLRPFLVQPNEALQHAWQSTQDEISAMQRLCASQQVRFLVALVPARQSVDPAALEASLGYVDFDAGDFDFASGYRCIADHCRALGVPCLDVVPEFRERIAKREALYLPSDMHWNARGHGLFAERLAPLVRAAL